MSEGGDHLSPGGLPGHGVKPALLRPLADAGAFALR